MFPFLSFIMGDVWVKWFGGQPELHHIVPRQLVLLLHHALDRVRVAWEKEENIRVHAATAYAVIAGESKKRRVTG